LPKLLVKWTSRETPLSFQRIAAPQALHLMYQRFLIYMNFFAAKLPVVLCEGKTDNIYLTHAICGAALLPSH
jgi:RNA-directed DNA polymerase